MSAVVFHDHMLDCKVVQWKLTINGLDMKGRYDVKLGHKYDRMDVFRNAVRELATKATEEACSSIAPAFLSPSHF